MARVQFTFTFTNAQPGAAVDFGPQTVKVYGSATDPAVDGRRVLDSNNSVTVWSEADHVIAMTTDGQGEPLNATATKTSPTVTTDEGTAGSSPFGSGTSSPIIVNTVAAHYVASADERIFCSAAATTDVTAPAPGGKEFTVINTGATGSVAVLPHAAETVIGAASYTVGPGASVTFADDNTDWWGI